MYVTKVSCHKDGELAGSYELWQYHSQLTEIKKLIVGESFRRRGIAKQMLKAAVERCKTKLIIATVRFENEFWWRENIKQGFKLVDRIYKDSGDVLVFLRNKSGSYPNEHAVAISSVSK